MRWVQVSADTARAHPLFGIKGWLALFAIGVVLLPGRFAADISNLSRDAGMPFWDVMKSDAPDARFATLMLVYSLVRMVSLVSLMASKGQSFRWVASLFVVLDWPAMFLIHQAFPYEGNASRVALTLVPWAGFTCAWLGYLQRSQRVRVTFERCVRESSALDNEKGPQPRTVSTAANAPTTSVRSDLGARARAPSNASVQTQVIEESREDLWATAYDELESDALRRGLWAKALAESQGDESAARAAYLSQRVQQLEEEVGRVRMLRDSEAAGQLAERRRKEDFEHVTNLAESFKAGKRLTKQEISLLARGVDVLSEVKTIMSRHTGDTVLHYCVRLGLEEEAQVLVAHGADRGARNGNGHTPYYKMSELEHRLRASE